MLTVKTVGASGQISLGKEYAGQNVLIDKIEEGVWVIKTGEFIPHSERWLHQPEVEKPLSRALQWAQKNKPSETDLDALTRKVGKQK